MSSFLRVNPLVRFQGARGCCQTVNPFGIKLIKPEWSTALFGGQDLDAHQPNQADKVDRGLKHLAAFNINPDEAHDVASSSPSEALLQLPNFHGKAGFFIQLL